MTTPQPDILDRLDAMALFLKEKALHGIIWDAMEEIREAGRKLLAEAQSA